MDAWFKIIVSSPAMQRWTCILFAHVDLREEGNGSKGDYPYWERDEKLFHHRSTGRSLNQIRATNVDNSPQLTHYRWTTLLAGIFTAIKRHIRHEWSFFYPIFGSQTQAFGTWTGPWSKYSAPPSWINFSFLFTIKSGLSIPHRMQVQPHPSYT